MWKVKVWKDSREYTEYVGGQNIKEAIDHILATEVNIWEILSVEAHFPERD